MNKSTPTTFQARLKEFATWNDENFFIGLYYFKEWFNDVHINYGNGDFDGKLLDNASAVNNFRFKKLLKAYKKGRDSSVFFGPFMAYRFSLIAKDLLKQFHKYKNVESSDSRNLVITVENDDQNFWNHFSFEENRTCFIFKATGTVNPNRKKVIMQQFNFEDDGACIMAIYYLLFVDRMITLQESSETESDVDKFIQFHSERENRHLNLKKEQ